MLDLRDRRAIVCGSTKGIGRASAAELAQRGATVLLLARDAAALKQVCSELPAPAGQVHESLVADFAQPAAVATAAAGAVERGGPVHVLVNNTGGPPSGPIAAATPEAFLQAFSAHVIANQLLVQAVLAGMKDAGFGRIINIISTSVLTPIRGLGVSNTIRAAVANWARTLAGEVAPHGITVNNVLPGYTDTDRLASLFARRAEASGTSAAEIREDIISTIPAGRLARAEEIAAVVGFLASPAASYVNGVNLPVDGGRTAGQ